MEYRSGYHHDWRLTRHEGKALADPKLRATTTQFYLQLERHLQLQFPHMKNIRIIRADSTGDWDTRTIQEWHEVVFIADDQACTSDRDYHP